MCGSAVHSCVCVCVCVCKCVQVCACMQLLQGPVCIVLIITYPRIFLHLQFQQEQMHEFCAEAADHIDLQLPTSSEELNTLFQHLLYDDSRRMVFCYVPKNGCSNMKRLMLVLNGILPPESSLERRPPEPVLKQVLATSTTYIIPTQT